MYNNNGLSYPHEEIEFKGYLLGEGSPGDPLQFPDGTVLLPLACALLIQGRLHSGHMSSLELLVPYIVALILRHSDDAEGRLITRKIVVMAQQIPGDQDGHIEGYRARIRILSTDRYHTAAFLTIKKIKARTIPGIRIRDEFRISIPMSVALAILQDIGCIYKYGWYYGLHAGYSYRVDYCPHGWQSGQNRYIPTVDMELVPGGTFRHPLLPSGCHMIPDADRALFL